MKKIYAVTLKSEEYLSGPDSDDLKLLAAMVYDYIYDFAEDGMILLNINKNIVHNKIHYARYFNSNKYGNTNYKMDSDIYDDGYINYEPFIVGNKTFAITIVDDMYGIEFLEKVIKYNLCLLKLRYKFKIEVFPYKSKDINDESHRDKAVNEVYNRYTYGNVKRNKIVRILKKGLCRRKDNVGLCRR